MCVAALWVICIQVYILLVYRLGMSQVTTKTTTILMI